MKKIFVALFCLLSLVSLDKAGAENVRLDEVPNSASSVSDVMREIAGVTVAQQGGPGQSAFIYIRGGESRNTLVYIDEIMVNSPITGEVDYADLTVDSIDHIEVVRGPLSSRYGSGAIGGVVRIFTKQAHVSGGTLSAETGSFDSIRENVSTSLKADRYDLQVNALHTETEGFSSAKAGNEKDGYKNITISSHLGITAGDTGRIEIFTRLTESHTDSDVPMSGGRPGDVIPADDNGLQQQKQWNLFGVSYKSDFTENWNQRVSFTNSDVEIINTGTMIKTADWQHHIQSNDGSDLTLGYEWQQQYGDFHNAFNKTFSNNAVYVQDKRGLKSPSQLSASLRWDDNTFYGSAFTYSAGISHTPATGVRWFANYGTGFKGPDLNSLFWPEDDNSKGNANLKPEKSKGWEIGTEQTVSGSMTMSVSYFRNSYEDLIQWIPDTAGKYQPQNRREALSDGVEAGILWQAGQSLRLSGTYTYNDTKDRDTRFYLQRRPLNKYGAVLLINPSGNLSFTIKYNHSGRRVEWADKDSDGKPDTQNIMSAYSIVDIAGSYKLSSTTEIFFRVENLLDEDYTEAIGYSTAGSSSYGGIKMTL